MSSGGAGATSVAPAIRPENATPALADQWEAEALDGIETVQDPAEAERLLAMVTACSGAVRLAKLGEDRERRWRVVRLKAERRYGELLPPKQPGKRTDREPVTGRNRSGADRVAQNRARQVASVPPGTFDAYLETDPAPSRQGLLRRSPRNPAGAKKQNTTGRRKGKGEPTIVDETKVQNDPDVLAWVRRHTRRGWTTDRLIEASRAGEADWPADKWPGGLSDTTVSAVRTAIVHLERIETQASSRAKSKESGRRLRDLHAEKRAGRTTTDLWHLQVAVAKAVAVLESFDLPDLDWTEYNQALVVEIYDDLERHMRWVDSAIDAVTAHMDELGRSRKLHMLRLRADDPSSTPSERANAARLADKLERRRRALR